MFYSITAVYIILLLHVYIVIKIIFQNICSSLVVLFILTNLFSFYMYNATKTLDLCTTVFLGISTSLFTLSKELHNHLCPSGKHVHIMFTPHTPLLYCKTGVCRGIAIFLIFAPKHRLDCGYSLEPPQRGSSNVCPQSML